MFQIYFIFIQSEMEKVKPIFSTKLFNINFYHSEYLSANKSGMFLSLSLMAF